LRNSTVYPIPKLEQIGTARSLIMIIVAPFYLICMLTFCHITLYFQYTGIPLY